MSSSPSSPSSSITATEPELDVESYTIKRKRPSHFKLLLDTPGVTQEVLEWKYRGKGTEDEPYVVEFIHNDAKNPMEFSPWKKWSITGVNAIAVLAVAFASSAYSGAVIEIIKEFHIGSTVAVLGVSLFVLGFALGPLIWAPLSEMYGRQRLFFWTYLALTAFNAGAAGSQNMETLIILRFMAGTFGSSPLTNAGGVIADMFSAKERGMATSLFAMAPFLGPSIGPIAGGFLGQVSWRWVEGLMAIFCGMLWIIVSLYTPETYAPVILRQRAQKLSKMTSKVYIAVVDEGKPKKTVTQEFKIALSRPWLLLFREPIVFLTAIYMAIIYGTLYMSFAAFPIVFQQQRGWSPGISGLAFLGMAAGMMIAVGYTIYDNKRYTKISEANNGMASPEARLPPAIIGSVLLPVGLFWFAWTNGPEIHWIVPIIATGFFGAGLVMVFLSLMNYIIDSYVIYAASSLAANAVVRSLFGAAFPLFTTQMYQNLGIHWASSVPAFLALACVPFPYLFHKYGEGIRMKCKYAIEAASVLARFRAGGSNDDNDDDERTPQISDTEEITTKEKADNEETASLR